MGVILTIPTFDKFIVNFAYCSLVLCFFSRVALLAGGDVLALLLFSSIGRFSHGLPVFDLETLRTADPFIAGMLVSEVKSLVFSFSFMNH